MTHSDWKQEQKDLYTSRLQATSIAGSSLPPIRANYIMQYAKSLIGRQLKLIAQTAVFHLHDLVSAKIYRLWKAIGVLSTMLWFPELDDIELYLVC